MEGKKQRPSWIWQTVMKPLVHPVVIISALGPLVLTFNVHWLLQLVNHSGNIEGIPAQLANTLSDPWVFAFGDYLIQLYTLVLAVVLYYIDLSRQIGILINKKGIQPVLTSHFTATLVFLSVLILFVGIIAVSTGMFASPEIVAMYLPTNGQTWGTTRLPPQGSLITVGRYVFVFLGIFLSVWLRKVDPTE